MAVADVSNEIAILKTLYDDQRVQNLTYKKHPLWAMLPKKEGISDMGGTQFPQPVIYENPQGGSASFAKAVTNYSPSQTTQFQIKRVVSYQLARISGELMESSQTNQAAFLDAAQMEIDNAFSGFGTRLAQQVYGDGTGSLGSYGVGTGAISTGVITLDSASSAVNFAVGQVLTSYSISGATPTVSTGGNLGYVIAVSTSAGTITVSATSGGAAGTPTNWSTSFPYLAIDGNVNFVSNGLLTGNTSVITGLLGWIPATNAVGSTLFWNVDRSVDPARLAGSFFDGSALPIEMALNGLLTQLYVNGGAPDYIFMNPVSFQSLANQLSTKVVYLDMAHDEADVLFKSIQIMGHAGPVNVIADRNCPAKKAFALTMDSWQFRSNGMAPHIQDYGKYYGSQAVPDADADSISIRLAMYGNLACKSPAYNGVCLLQD